jgi:hypothetical protein
LLFRESNFRFLPFVLLDFLFLLLLWLHHAG